MMKKNGKTGRRLGAGILRRAKSLTGLSANSKRGLSSAAFIAYGMAIVAIGFLSLFASDDGRRGKSDPDASPVVTGSVTMPEQSRTPQTFAAFLVDVKRDGRKNGISSKLLERVFADMQIDPDILDFTTSQPEHARAPWDYIEAMVSDKRIADGRDMLRRHRAILDKIEQIYGVDRHIVVAIWGVESSYGSGQGGRNVLRSLATLAYQDQRRRSFWKKQLIAALKIVANGDIVPEVMTGSWAGAMGHTQFMPTTYLAHAVDLDGDGKRDIWDSIVDALASTAAYLKASNWQRGLAWGHEVIVPEGFDYSLSAPGYVKTFKDWAALGLTIPPRAKTPAPESKLSLLLPAGNRGPAFLVSAKFKSILRYNHSNLYALSVGHLADRLANGPRIMGNWPRHLKPLAKDQRVELQRLLVARGLDTGGIDGILGGRTQAAIRSYQSAQNLPADGFPSSDLLERLRGATKPGKSN